MICPKFWNFLCRSISYFFSFCGFYTSQLASEYLLLIEGKSVKFSLSSCTWSRASVSVLGLDCRGWICGSSSWILTRLCSLLSLIDLWIGWTVFRGLALSARYLFAILLGTCTFFNSACRPSSEDCSVELVEWREEGLDGVCDEV